MDSGGITWNDVGDVWNIPHMWEADLNGIYAEVAPTLDADQNPDEPWFWSVKTTGKRSEWPEVYNSGRARCLTEAKKRAEAFMREADAAYQTMGPEGW
jgi:hypothetical protein